MNECTGYLNIKRMNIRAHFSIKQAKISYRTTEAREHVCIFTISRYTVIYKDNTEISSKTHQKTIEGIYLTTHCKNNSKIIVFFKNSSSYTLIV